MKRILILICFLAINVARGEGFLSGTLVKVSNGYIPIEELKEGDKVICFDFKGSCIERSVTHIEHKGASRFFRVVVNGEEIVVADDHIFYLPLEGKWVKAEELKVGHSLLKNCLEFVKVGHILEIVTHDIAYDLTVEEYHNFCVSREDILVHNIIPLFAWGAGQGLAFVGWNAVGMGVLATLGGIASKFFVNGAFKKLFGASGRTAN